MQKAETTPQNDAANHYQIIPHIQRLDHPPKQISTTIFVDFQSVGGELKTLNKEIANQLDQGEHVSHNLISDWYDRYRQIEKEMDALRKHFYICGLQLYRASEGVQHG